MGVSSSQELASPVFHVPRTTASPNKPAKRAPPLPPLMHDRFGEPIMPDLPPVDPAEEERQERERRNASEVRTCVPLGLRGLQYGASAARSLRGAGAAGIVAALAPGQGGGGARAGAH